MLFRDYRRIEGHPDYIISNYGEVFSLKKPGQPIELSSSQDKKGYKCVGLQMTAEKKRLTVRVHALVGAAFIGKRTGNLTYDHIDRDNGNNLASNLRLATPAEQKANQNLRVDNKLRQKYIAVTGDGLYYRIKIVRGGIHLYYQNFRVDEYSLYEVCAIRNAALRDLKIKDWLIAEEE